MSARRLLLVLCAAVLIGGANCPIGPSSIVIAETNAELVVTGLTGTERLTVDLAGETREVDAAGEREMRFYFQLENGTNTGRLVIEGDGRWCGSFSLEVQGGSGRATTSVDRAGLADCRDPEPLLDNLVVVVDGLDGTESIEVVLDGASRTAPAAGSAEVRLVYTQAPGTYPLSVTVQDGAQRWCGMFDVVVPAGAPTTEFLVAKPGLADCTPVTEVEVVVSVTGLDGDEAVTVDVGGEVQQRPADGLDTAAFMYALAPGAYDGSVVVERGPQRWCGDFIITAVVPEMPVGVTLDKATLTYCGELEVDARLTVTGLDGDETVAVTLLGETMMAPAQGQASVAFDYSLEVGAHVGTIEVSRDAEKWCGGFVFDVVEVTGELLAVVIDKAVMIDCSDVVEDVRLFVRIDELVVRDPCLLLACETTTSVSSDQQMTVVLDLAIPLSVGLGFADYDELVTLAMSTEADTLFAGDDPLCPQPRPDAAVETTLTRHITVNGVPVDESVDVQGCDGVGPELSALLSLLRADLLGL